ncbi:MAG TPA: c-type cytochrome [Casimicrobiaceae bacterium]|nr:c-type cytochrome [Casimicrobiaceae bacterium]
MKIAFTSNVRAARRAPIVIALGLAVAYLASQALAQAPAPADRTGEQVVKARCIECHGTGKNGAPRIGDKQAWIPRMKNGFDVVVRSAIKGHGAMPPRGGMADLTDGEIRSAIAYMFQAAGGNP